jgi:hypothetical protein
MRLWLPVLLAVVLVGAGGASALAIPSLGGPTGLIMLPTARTASPSDWQTAIGQRDFRPEFMYSDTTLSLWTLNALKGVSSDAELWIAYTRATNGEDTNVWEYGGKYRLTGRVLPNLTGFFADMDISIGGSLGRYPDAVVGDALSMYTAEMVPVLTDIETRRFYVVATKQIIPFQLGEWDWEAPPSTRVIGTVGLMYLRVEADQGSSDKLYRPFFGVEVIGQKNLALALEYRVKDSDLEEKALFSAMIRYPIDTSTDLEVGITNASPIGLGQGDQDLFVRLGYKFPVAAYQ